MPIGTHVSLITLNVNGLNVLPKRYRLTEWTLKGWRKIFRENGNQKKARVAILISDKIRL